MRLKLIPRKITFATFAFVSVIAPKIGVIHIECSLPNPNNPLKTANYILRTYIIYKYTETAFHTGIHSRPLPKLQGPIADP